MTWLDTQRRIKELQSICRACNHTIGVSRDMISVVFFEAAIPSPLRNDSQMQWIRSVVDRTMACVIILQKRRNYRRKRCFPNIDAQMTAETLQTLNNATPSYVSQYIYDMLVHSLETRGMRGRAKDWNSRQGFQ